MKDPAGRYTNPSGWRGMAWHGQKVFRKANKGGLLPTLGGQQELVAGLLVELAVDGWGRRSTPGARAPGWSVLGSRLWRGPRAQACTWKVPFARQLNWHGHASYLKKIAEIFLRQTNVFHSHVLENELGYT